MLMMVLLLLALVLLLLMVLVIRLVFLMLLLVLEFFAVAGVGDCFGAFDGAGKLQGVYFCKQTKQPLLCTCRPIDISTNIKLGRKSLL